MRRRHGKLTSHGSASRPPRRGVSERGRGARLVAAMSSPTIVHPATPAVWDNAPVLGNASWYIASGLAVLPVAHRDKRPRSGFRWGSVPKPQDVESIEALFTETPPTGWSFSTWMESSCWRTGSTPAPRYATPGSSELAEHSPAPGSTSSSERLAQRRRSPAALSTMISA